MLRLLRLQIVFALFAVALPSALSFDCGNTAARLLTRPARNIMLLGGPGAGKTTQGNLLVQEQEQRLPHIDMGDLLRQQRAKGTELGKQADEYMRKGLIVPDKTPTFELMLALLKTKLAEAKDGFILNGFPRTEWQAEQLDRILSELGIELDIVVNLDIDDDSAIRRLLARKRAGETPAVIKKRIEVYRAEFAPILAHYRAKGLLKRVNSVAPNDDPKLVLHDLKHVLGWAQP